MPASNAARIALVVSASSIPTIFFYQRQVPMMMVSVHPMCPSVAFAYLTLTNLLRRAFIYFTVCLQARPL